MGQTPDEIRVEVEQTRAGMTETVEAIGHKVDVPGRVRESVGEKKDAVVGAVSGAADSVAHTVHRAASTVTGGVGEQVPDAEQVKRSARKGVAFAEDNPLGLAIGGAALGFIVGLVLPAARLENEKLGAVAEDVRKQVEETGHEAFERGKQVVQDAGESALETVKERGQEEGEELAGMLHDRVGEAASRHATG